LSVQTGLFHTCALRMESSPSTEAGRLCSCQPENPTHQRSEGSCHAEPTLLSADALDLARGAATPIAEDLKRTSPIGWLRLPGKRDGSQPTTSCRGNPGHFDGRHESGLIEFQRFHRPATRDGHFNADTLALMRRPHWRRARQASCTALGATDGHILAGPTSGATSTRLHLSRARRPFDASAYQALFNAYRSWCWWP